MIGMTIAVIKGFSSLETIEKTWGTERIDIPKAPGLGLLLEEVFSVTKLHIIVQSISLS